MSDNGRRILALGASVGLVALAFVVRGRADDGDGPGGGGGDGGDRLVCATELGDVCDALADDYDVTVEDAFTTAEQLIGTDSGRAPADLWLAPRPWVEAVEVSRELGGNEPMTGETSDTIARSPVVLVVQVSRSDTLAGSCGGTITWQCVGDAADGPWTAVGGQSNWGTVKAGIADPAAGANLVTLGAAAADFLDDPGFASNDFDGALDNWLAGLAATATAADRPDAVGEMITGGAGIMAVLGTVEAEAGPALDSDLVQVVVPEPVVTADLVAVPLVDSGGGDGGDSGGGGGGGDADDLAGDGDLLDALAEAGWRVDGRDPAPGIDTGVELPDQGNLPQGDVLWVLLQRWQQLV